MANTFAMNVAPVEVADISVTAGILPYRGDEQLQELRRIHDDTHHIRRDRDRLLCVPVVANAAPIGEEREGFRLLDSPWLAASLARHALIRHVHSLGRSILKFAPVTFLANERENLLSSVSPDGLAVPPWLAVLPRYELDVRLLYPFDRPLVALVLDVHLSRRITCTCDSLQKQGISMRGLYVRRLEAVEGVLADKFGLVGRVRDEVDGILHLEDFIPGVGSIPASEAYPEARECFDMCMEAVFGEAHDAVRSELHRRMAEFHQGPGRLQKLEQVLKYLGGGKVEMLPGVPLRVGGFMTQAAGGVFPTVHEARNPVYVFAENETHTSNSSGISRFGPHSAHYFTPCRPRICVIGQASRKGRLEQFLHKFLHGIPGEGQRWGPFERGFLKTYALDDATHEYFLANDGSARSYRDAGRRAVEKQTDTGQKWDLALVEVEDATHQLHGSENPYIVTKALLLQHHVSVQEFRLETAALPDSQLAWAVSNMALATYAKLGGTPWLIKADRTIAHELVVGMGSAMVDEGRLGEKERIVGITTVFSGDGNYRLSNLSRAVPMAEYGSALLDSLQSTIVRLRDEMNWQKGDHVRLVFHAFKPIKDTEAEAVGQLMATLEGFQVDYAFLHVADNHPYLLFDTGQPGIPDGRTRETKGAFAPPRGRYLHLSRSEVLLVLTGLNEIKQAHHGMPTPVKLSLHRASTFKDTTYLARQVFSFSSLSWQGFQPSPLPVTIWYSELIARMLGKLGELPNWNPDAMLGEIGRTRWFL